ncbi:hypothetical protein CPB83DRAFT_869883 [Crepidotus variabilis]|uniref:Uncharacterized protein n=1 Tax=Crepidotus variabilis TaxID=179855 RepID=A0A9P6EEB5_9AGAR|nr:hypothetical protein CPB83DRAFT_869883 [Crepidotus variabilis]
MKKAHVTQCGDGYYCRCIYRIGPYIADYLEQCLLACVVQGWCPNNGVPCSHKHKEALLQACDGEVKRLWEGYGYIADIKPFTSHFPWANIYELLLPDLLHQVIKGTFKDHLVSWIKAYFKTQPNGSRLLAEMDRRIAAAHPFAGLRRFPEGRNFKQWTGDSSKALMKVFLPAIAGLVPDGMVRAISAFLEFCYLVCCSEISKDILDQIEAVVTRFHDKHTTLLEYGIRDNFLLPRQHSLNHYHISIQMFGTPNRLCSSITKSKHIKAVKEPYRHSSHWEALGQMLEDVDAEDAEGSALWGDVQLPKRTASGYPCTVEALSAHLHNPALSEYIHRFLYDQQNPDSNVFEMDIPLDQCPQLPDNMRVCVYHSASALYHAPSDLSGIGGMHREYICSSPSWKHSHPRHDIVFIEHNPDKTGFRGLGVAQVWLFLSFHFGVTRYNCALVQWFEHYQDSPCPVTGMWRVQPDYTFEEFENMKI